MNDLNQYTKNVVDELLKINKDNEILYVILKEELASFSCNDIEEFTRRLNSCYLKYLFKVMER